MRGVGVGRREGGCVVLCSLRKEICFGSGR